MLADFSLEEDGLRLRDFALHCLHTGMRNESRQIVEDPNKTHQLMLSKNAIIRTLSHLDTSNIIKTVELFHIHTERCCRKRLVF